MTEESKKLLQDEKTPAAVCLGICIKEVEDENNDLLYWEPEVLRSYLEDEGVELTDMQHDKIQAAIGVLTTDYFENDLSVFETTCELFNNRSSYLTEQDIIEWEDLARGHCEATIIRHESIEYSKEILAYIGIILHEQLGLDSPPTIFPDAIIVSSSVDTTEEFKEADEALTELFNAYKDHILSYKKDQSASASSALEDAPDNIG